MARPIAQTLMPESTARQPAAASAAAMEIYSCAKRECTVQTPTPEEMVRHLWHEHGISTTPAWVRSHFLTSAFKDARRDKQRDPAQEAGDRLGWGIER